MKKITILSGLCVFILSSCGGTHSYYSQPTQTFDPREVVSGTSMAKSMQDEETRENWLGKAWCERFFKNPQDCQAYWRQKFEENPIPAARKQASPAARTQADNSGRRAAEPSPSAFSQTCGEKTLSECLNQ